MIGAQHEFVITSHSPESLRNTVKALESPYRLLVEVQHVKNKQRMR